MLWFQAALFIVLAMISAVVGIGMSLSASGIEAPQKNLASLAWLIAGGGGALGCLGAAVHAIWRAMVG